MHPSRCCHFETKFSEYDTFRTPKVQLLRICSSVLLNLFSSHCEPRIFASLERKRGGNNSRTSTLSWLCMDINLFLFLYLCSILRQSTRSEMQYFFRYLFPLSCGHLRLHSNDAQISSLCFQIQHESSEESIKKASKKREEMK